MARKPKVPDAPEMFGLLPDWVREMKANHQSPATIDKYTRCLTYFCAWLSPDGDPTHCTTRIDQVTKQIAQDYFSFLYGAVAQNTVLSRHIALSSFFKFCLAYDLLPDGAPNPIRFVKSPKAEVAPTHVLTEAEIRALLATCEHGKDYRSVRDYAVLRTFMATGLRLAELLALKRDDINLNDGIIRVEHGKGGRPRETAIGAQVARALGKYLLKRQRHKDAHRPQLWLGKQGPMTYGGIQSIVYTRAREAGLKIHSHQFRHLFAHGYLEKGGQESALLTLAGWKNPKMLHERYGASRAKERAIAEHHRLGIGEDW